MKKVILSINANRAMSFLLETVMNSKYTFYSARDAFQGMRTLKSRNAINVIIVDIDFNTLENLEFISHITASRLYQGCNVIVLASPATIENRELDELNPVRVFKKPFSPQQLLDHIETLFMTETKVSV